MVILKDTIAIKTKNSMHYTNTTRKHILHIRSMYRSGNVRDKSMASNLFLFIVIFSCSVTAYSRTNTATTNANASFYRPGTFVFTQSTHLFYYILVLYVICALFSYIYSMFKCSFIAYMMVFIKL